MESAQAIERERNYGSAGDTAQGVSDGLPKRQRTIVLAVMMSGTTAACISQSMMIAALPTIMHEYSVSASLGQLLTTSYIFTLGLIIGFAPAIGPTVSGFLIDFWGWRSVFVILGAVSAVVVVLSFFVLSDVVKREGSRERFDVPSGLLYTLGFCGIMLGTTVMESDAAFDPVSLAALAGGALALFVFARRQARIEQPLLKLSCFRNRTFAIATVLVMMSQMAFMVGSIMVPLFVQDVQGGSATVSGLTILPGAVLLGFLNPVTGRLLDRYGPRPLVAVGCAVLAAGTLAFAACDAGTPEWAITVLYGVRTVGVACLMMPMTAHACAALSLEDIAQGTAIITSFRQIFGALSSSALITVMALASSNELGIDVGGFALSFEVQAAVIVVGFVVGMACLPRPQRKTR